MTRPTVVPAGPVLATATTASSGALATFMVNGQAVQCQVARDLTIAAGDVALLLRVGIMWVAVCRLFTAAPAVTDTEGLPDPDPATVSGLLVIAPVETRSYRSSDGWRTATDDVMQGDPTGTSNYTGCAFYGTAAQALSGATVTAATVRLRRPARGGNPAAQPLTLRLVTETTRPAGAPTLSSSTAGPSLAWSGESVFTLPAAWAQAMVDGTAGGIAVANSGAPFVLLSGTGDYGPAFTLTVSWTR